MSGLRLKVERWARIERVGAKVWWLKTPGMDLTLTVYMWGISLGVYMHDSSEVLVSPVPVGDYDVIFRKDSREGQTE